MTTVPWSDDGLAAVEAGSAIFVAGHILFKQAPARGRLLAAAALGEGLDERLAADAKLGQPQGD